MIEPVVTISLSEYNSLLAKADMINSSGMSCLVFRKGSYQVVAKEDAIAEFERHLTCRISDYLAGLDIDDESIRKFRNRKCWHIFALR